jgi:phytanoyl-CoA dioxygenase PhyH
MNGQIPELISGGGNNYIQLWEQQEIVMLAGNKMAVSESTENLRSQGYHIIRSVLPDHVVERFRALTTANLDTMARTRDAEHSRHLAGFHRFPALATLHSEIASNRAIGDTLSDYYEGRAYYAIGLSDITVNRSQQWHTDLLRGAYSEFLKDGSPWVETRGSCIKALVYLQAGNSLRVLPGFHLAPTPLDDPMLDSLARTEDTTELNVEAGDVVMMDIRTVHRGATDEEMSEPKLARSPKILVSTVFGLIASAFTQAMQLGNVQRMVDWDRRYL